jgi:hypothetical protein
MGAQGGEAQSGFAPGGFELEAVVLVVDFEDEDDVEDVVTDVDVLLV